MTEPLLVDLGFPTADGVVRGSLAISDLDDLVVEVGDTIEVMDSGEGPYEAEVVEVNGDTIRVQAPAFKPYRGRERSSPELVQARDLIRWADKVEAHHEFPRIVRRLLTGVPGVPHPLIRAGEGVRSPGWDGLVECGPGAPYVPAEKSVWEIGTGNDPGRKAQDDYRKRTDDPCGVDPAETAFVFVTPRRWPNKEKWVHSRSEEDIWREVRVLDADDLEGWLESSYIDHVWVSEQLGRRPLEAVSLDRWWYRWSTQTEPVLPPALLVAGRQAEAGCLRRAMDGPPTVTGVQAASRKEAMAFASVALGASESDAVDLPRAVVVYSSAVWDRCASAPGSFILMPQFEDCDSRTAIRSGHHVLIPMGAGDRGEDALIVLPRIGRTEARAAFAAAGAPPDRADRYAVAARRSLMSLYRRISLDPRLARPAWAQGEEADLLVALVLVGSWSVTNDPDHRIVERITGRNIEAVERLLLSWENTWDPPFRRSGDTWRMANPKDAWSLLRHMVTRNDLRRWHEAAVEVLGTYDPVLDLPTEERFFAPLHGVKQKWSSDLRRGLAQGAALLGALELPRAVGGQTGADHARNLVWELLDRAGDDYTGRLWQSLSDVLPLLAEAAPDVFLEVVRRGSAAGNPLLAKMFTDTDKDPLWGGSPTHTGLLWALETLCWSQDYLPVALDALMRLAEIDPGRRAEILSGGQVFNRPLDSARRVLLPWLPQTSASLERRMDVLDGVLSRHEIRGWDLLMSLADLRNSTHDISKPRFRDWVPDNRTLTREEYHNAIEAITFRVIRQVGSSSFLWAQLIKQIPDLSPEQREQVIDALESLIIDELDDEDGFKIWRALNRLLDSHPDRDVLEKWLSTEGLDRLEDIRARMRYDTLEVMLQDKIKLFDWYPGRSNRERQDAIREIYESGGLSALRYLAKEVARPELVGRMSADIMEDVVVDGLIPLLAQEGADCAFTMAWMERKAELGGVEWIERTAKSLTELPDTVQANFWLSLRPNAAVWKLLEDIPGQVRDLYWQQIREARLYGCDTTLLVDYLLEHDRPLLAVRFIALPDKGAQSIPSEMMERVLINLIYSKSEPIYGLDSFYIGKLLDRMEKEIPESETLVLFELAFFQSFRMLEERSPVALYRRLQADPLMFVELVCSAHRTSDRRAPRRVMEVVVPQVVAWSVLREWRTLPGTEGSTGALDHEELRTWVLESRRLLHERDRADIGDEYIGQLLSGSPEGEDGVWPAEPVRDLLEDLDSQSLESGLANGRLNSRGVTVRDPFEGGVQERELADQYRSWAQQVEAGWPCTGRVLRQLSDCYERKARHHDQDAERFADQG